MSKFKNEINRGAIFVNDNNKNKNAPNKSGKFVDENGVTKRIAIWENVSKNGLKYELFIIQKIIESTGSKAIEDISTNNEMPF